MGIFDFMKKKDPLDDLTLPEESPGSNPFANDVHPAAEQNNFTPPDLGAFGSTPEQDTMSSFDSQPQFGQPQGAQQSNQFEQPGYNPSGTTNSFNTQPERQQTNNSQNTTTREHELELINSKLDTIRAIMESLGQRISGLESRLSIESERRRRQW